MGHLEGYTCHSLQFGRRGWRLILKALLCENRPPRHLATKSSENGWKTKVRRNNQDFVSFFVFDTFPILCVQNIEGDYTGALIWWNYAWFPFCAFSKQKIDNPGSKQKHEKWFAGHISMCMTRQTTQGQTKSDLDSPRNMLHVILWQRKTNTKTPRRKMINNSTEKKKDETKACQRTLQANY